MNRADNSLLFIAGRGRIMGSPGIFAGRIMGHYQEDGIGVKGFTSDRGSILKESPETPRA